MKIKEIVLRINHFAFSWYYRSCGNHFKQWTFRRSVKILSQNYNHQQHLLKDSENQKRELIKANDRLRKELFNIKINQCANMQEVGTVVKIFKGNINSVSDN